MSLTLWHRCPILLLIGTCFSEVQITTLATFCGVARLGDEHCVQIGPRRKRYWEDRTITEKREGKCCGRALKVA